MFKLKAFIGAIAAGILATGLSVSAVADEEVLTGKSSTEITSMMGLGWNLGNTFDATGGGDSSVIYAHEMSWGNPKVTQELIDGVKASGFDTIRIPITWAQELDANYQIKAEFMDRVQEVVDMAIENDMFVIINVHHEKWVNNVNITKTYEKVGEELSAVWAQIADRFADYDQHLIFEGMNEPRDVGESYEWSGTEAGYEAINYLNQVFVNTVRTCDKGHNAERCLMIPGYAASSSAVVMNSIAIPTVNGKSAGNLIISVHCYAPYNFCLSDTMKNFDINDSNCVGEIDTIFENIKKYFLDNGLAVVIGETSATAKNNVEARENWAYYMGSKSKAYGVPIVIWDNGSNSNSGGESHAHINRTTGEPNYPTVIEKLTEGYNSVDAGSALGGNEEIAESLIGGSIIWSNAEGLTSKKQWDAGYISLGSSVSYYVDGRDIAVVFSGAGNPKLVLDSEAQQQWWMPVDPDEIKEQDGRKIAIFTKKSIDKVLADYSITSYGNLRNFIVIAVDDNITTYEIALTGDQRSVTYVVNGKTVAVGTEMPSDPSFTNMTFGGWYTTKDYQEGTEYTGGKTDKDITVYAKFILDQSVLAGGPSTKVPEETEKETTKEDKTEASDEKNTEISDETSAASEETTAASTEAETEEDDDVASDELNNRLIIIAVCLIVFALGMSFFLKKKFSR